MIIAYITIALGIISLIYVPIVVCMDMKKDS